MPNIAPKQSADPGTCLICGVSLDHREGPLAEIKRLQQRIEDLSERIEEYEDDWAVLSMTIRGESGASLEALIEAHVEQKKLATELLRLKAAGAFTR